MEASSKVNFSKLNRAEQERRYINQKQEIKKLKKQLRNYTKKNGNKALQHLYTNELTDERLLLENMCRAVISGKLVPNTLAYNQICTILRDILQIPYTNKGYLISLPDKKLNISSIEYEAYSKLPFTDSILLRMIGREGREQEDPFKLLQIFSGPTILSKTEIPQENSD